MKMISLALDGGSFNPPTIAHDSIERALSRYFGREIIWPCGYRLDKESTNQVDLIHRRNMISLGFSNLPPNVSINFYDLDNNVFTPNHVLQARFEKFYEVWHVVGYDLVRDGKNKNSYIHQNWAKSEEMWDTLNFAVITRPNCGFDPTDLPPNNKVFHFNFSGSSTEAREKARLGLPLTGIVNKEVEEYMEKYDPYNFKKLQQ